jgi:hypothetical protein
MSIRAIQGSPRAQHLGNVGLDALQLPHGGLIVFGRQPREDIRIPGVLRPPDDVPKALWDGLGYVVHRHVVHGSTLSTTGRRYSGIVDRCSNTSASIG